ncbi:hypothetical protein K457DRAFT_336968 [Linnemannia elongata AG-77]|uniref:Uncharacterized protein n=1 Tax=Linnemannia elongata AG-77 TaxID=1314771 RepID=A0A197K595_9FUNG|nr:hypothetical protein K457DRAFT_336968 [Linnemannia elongata AG-77]
MTNSPTNNDKTAISGTTHTSLLPFAIASGVNPLCCPGDLPVHNIFLPSCIVHVPAVLDICLFIVLCFFVSFIFQYHSFLMNT